MFLEQIIKSLFADIYDKRQDKQHMK